MFPILAWVVLGTLAIGTVWKVVNWMRPIPLNCPKCGQPMQAVKAPQRGDGIVIVECPLDGPFHLGPKGDLTAGMPRK